MKRDFLRKSLCILSLMLLCLLTACGSQVADKNASIETSNKETTESTIQSEDTINNESNSTTPEQNTLVSETDSVEGELEVHYLDVGQGDASLIVFDGHAMLIDAGPDSKGTAVQYYLQKQGISSLDYVVITHPDTDHIGGMDVILTKFECKNVIMLDAESDTAAYRDVCSAMEYKHYKATQPTIGSQYKLGEVSVTFLGPKETVDNDNDNSIICLVEYGKTSFLFTGDAEAKGENVLCSGNLSVDVYQVGHHGSETSSSEKLLDLINPQYAIISCGTGNAYGHPHEAVLNRLKSRNIEVFRTDEQGSIVATSDGNVIRWNASPSTTWMPGVPESLLVIETEPTDNNQNDTLPVAPIIRTNEPESEADAITYVLNTNSKKFHLPTCGSVSDMKAKNRKDVNWIREAVIEAGYEPCKRCNP